MGIVNVTEDSFSDGGRYLDPALALEHARRLLSAGADIVDLGPASSHPDATPIPAEKEIERLAPLIDALIADGADVSVDSCLPETQRYAIRCGVGILNDIRGFAHPWLHPELAEASCRLVVMHSVQQAETATLVAVAPEDLPGRIDAFFAARIRALEAAGVVRGRLILDPGMGLFLGSRPEASTAVLRDLSDLRRRFGIPVMVSVSRKSFLGAITGRDVAGRGAATLAAELYAAAQGVDYIRTHDAAALRDALTVVGTLT